MEKKVGTIMSCKTYSMRLDILEGKGVIIQILYAFLYSENREEKGEDGRANKLIRITQRSRSDLIDVFVVFICSIMIT